MKKEIFYHERRDFKDVRELVLAFEDLYRDKIAYSYRIKPSDSEPVKKTYGDLKQDVVALATELINRGYAGKHISVVGKLSYEWVLIYYASFCIGSVLVPLDKDWGSAELADTLKTADVSLLFIDCDLEEKKKEIEELVSFDDVVYNKPEGNGGIWELIEAGREKVALGDDSFYKTKIDPDSMAILVFTSGTTGKGKGVMLSQTNILLDLTSITPHINFSQKTIGLLPPHHTYGSSVSILGHNSIGIEVYISSGLRHVTRELKSEAPGHLVLVPLYLQTFYRKIMAGIKDSGKEKLVFSMMKLSNALRKIGIDLRKKLFGKSILGNFGGNLNLVISGGAPINQEIINTFDALGITVLNGYGITECSPLISVNRDYHNVKGSVGKTICIDTIKIAEPNEDGEGEICVKGPNVMLGYYKNEDATREAFDEEGYFKTGDYGKLSDDNIITITGRKKNLIILSNGKNVYPEEIENELIATPGVLEIIVYEGQSRRGIEHNAIVAEIYPDMEYCEKNGITDIKAYLDPYIDNYNKTAVPYKKIQVLKVRSEEFPKNTLRKVLRFKIDMSID